MADCSRLVHQSSKHSQRRPQASSKGLVSMRTQVLSLFVAPGVVQRRNQLYQRPKEVRTSFFWGLSAPSIHLNNGPLRPSRPQG